MLLDTYGLVYRAFFALPALMTSKGVPINAAYGFLTMLLKIVADEKPTHVIAAFDKGLPQARLALYDQYKAQRDKMPDDLRSQFELVRRILATYRIPIVEIEGVEADDVIATLARRAVDEGKRVSVVTGDLDLLQIVDDATTVLVTRRGISELGRYDPAAVRERFDLDPSQLADYRGLKGDPSDNLPGIPGVGEKTASKLIRAAGSLDNLLADPGLAGSAKLSNNSCATYGEQARIYRDVSVVSRDLALILSLWTRRALRRRPPKRSRTSCTATSSSSRRSPNSRCRPASEATSRAPARSRLTGRVRLVRGRDRIGGVRATRVGSARGGAKRTRRARLAQRRRDRRVDGGRQSGWRSG